MVTRSSQTGTPQKANCVADNGVFGQQELAE
jgi:hypothetical protein